MRSTYLYIILLTLPLRLWASDFVSCDQLQSIYIDKYVSEFQVDNDSLQWLSLNWSSLECESPNPNYILARSFSDLDHLQPTQDQTPNFYNIVSQSLSQPGRSLRYIEKLELFMDANNQSCQPKVPGVSSPQCFNIYENFTLATFNDEPANLSSIFLTHKYVHSNERIRPTYLLVHEARHTHFDEPQHVVCTNTKSVEFGEQACDETLGNEDQLLKGSGNSHEFLFLLQVRNHPSATPIMKKEAQEQLNYLATHLFNTIEKGMLQYYNVQIQ